MILLVLKYTIFFCGSFTMPAIQSTDLTSFINALNLQVPCRKYTKLAEGAMLRNRNTYYGDYQYDRYSLVNVSDLLERLSFDTSDFLSDEDHAIRYVIPADNSQEAYFSLEGSEKYGVAAHERLSPKCLAAGMLYFTKQGAHISLVGMNHDSGYFQPTVESLIWPLKLFLSNQTFNLESDLQLGCRVGDDQIVYTLNVESLYRRLENVTPTISSFEEAQPCSGSYEAYLNAEAGRRKAERDCREESEQQELPRKSPKKSPRNIEQLEANYHQSEPMGGEQKEESLVINGFRYSHNSAFSLWKPAQSRKIVVSEEQYNNHTDKFSAVSI